MRLRTFSQLAEKYVSQLESLMTDDNPMVRLRALESFRRTVGMESPTGVSVNVNQTAMVTSGASFESMLIRVRDVVAMPVADDTKD